MDELPIRPNRVLFTQGSLDNIPYYDLPSCSFDVRVSSKEKFFHAFSAFATRPDILIPYVRSTDLEWESINVDLRNKNNHHDSKSLFDLLYSSVYYEGKVTQGLHVGELYGPLGMNTISAWCQPENATKIELTRSVNLKPNDAMLGGWSCKLNEIWDFENYLVQIAPQLDSLKWFPTLEAVYLPLDNMCEITVTKSRVVNFIPNTYPSVASVRQRDRRFLMYVKVIVPELVKWMSDDYLPGTPKLTRLRARPLSYVLNSQYWCFYDMIKSGPADYIKSIWTESTDPEKFVHEDVGIAAYISAFIKETSQYRPINNLNNVDILDLGCGNGLLCYFLNYVFSGTCAKSRVAGFDLQQRKLWAKLLEKENKNQPSTNTARGSIRSGESELKLVVRTILPHLLDDLIKEYGVKNEDRENRSLWLIGNHSDELTPWIPVLARMMNASGFFIIPCCPFDFFKKYQRRSNIAGKSNYHNYLEYICTVGDDFGYKPMLDNLRIPSTKKICVVGLDCSRNFEAGQLDAKVAKVMEELKGGNQQGGIVKFVPREDPRQTGVFYDRTIQQGIVVGIFNLIMKGWEEKISKQDGWYTGRDDVTFKEIAEGLSDNEREGLKKMGNGLRTVIKSHRNLFTFEGNIVKLRVPKPSDIKHVSQSSRHKIKTRECFFKEKHPQGCPLSEELCSFKH